MSVAMSRVPIKSVPAAVGRSANGSAVRKGVARPTTTMKLTTRGKAVFASLGAAVLLAASFGIWNGAAAQSAPTSLQVTSYVVRPGDTLWAYAEQITKPGDDVRSTVQELMQLNHLDSASLVAGQRLLVPAGQE